MMKRFLTLKAIRNYIRLLKASSIKAVQKSKEFLSPWRAKAAEKFSNLVRLLKASSAKAIQKSKKLLGRKVEAPENFNNLVRLLKAKFINLFQVIKSPARSSGLRQIINTCSRFLKNLRQTVIGRGQGLITGATVTLEINSSVARILEIRGGKVVRWASVPLEPDTVEGTAIPNPRALEAAIKNLRAASGINKSDIVIGINALQSVNRLLPLSRLPPGGSLRERVQELAKEIMPFAANKLYLSGQNIADGNNAKFLFLGFFKDAFDRQLENLAASGIKLQSLEYRPLALARTANKEEAVILNIEPSSFDIVVMVKGMPEIMRTVAWQEKALSLEQRVDNILSNLEMILNFYNTHNPGNSVLADAPLLITGESSETKGLVEELRGKTGHPVEQMGSPLEHPPDFPVSQYMVNIGLGLNNKTPRKDSWQTRIPRINLLPESYRTWKASAKQLALLGILLAASVLIFLAYQLITLESSKTAELQTRYAALNRQLQNRQMQINSLAPLENTITQQRIIFSMREDFTENIKAIIDEAKNLGVTVQAIVQQKGTLTLNVEAADYIAFRNFLKFLGASQKFSDIVSPTERFPYIKGGVINLKTKKTK